MVVESFSGFFDGNPYFTAGVGVLGVGAGLAMVRQGTTRALTLIRRQLLVTLEIPSRDKSYLWFLQWMSQQQRQSGRRTHQYAVETTFKQHDNGSITTHFSL